MELDVDKMSSEDFVNSVKDEILNDNIYVFTPKGDIFELPSGSTPIDFAYKIHTAVGDTMVGAIVNNNIVSLDYELKSNDIVKIITNKNSSPSKEWLKIAKTTQARNKIKNYFAKSEKEVYIDRGKELLEKELRKKKITFQDFYTDENISDIIKETKCDDIDDLYFNIGNSKFSPQYIVNLVFKQPEIQEIKQITLPKGKDTDIIVNGIDKIKVNISNCCNPLPGDEIIGYISKNNGITIHRINCPNLDRLEDRIINVSWNDNPTSKYLTSILVTSNKNDKAMLEIMQKASVSNISIDNIKTLSRTDTVIYEIDLWLRSLEKLNNFMRDIKSLNYIISVERVMK